MSVVAPTAHALSAFRILPDGRGRAYSATTFPRDPYGGCEQFIRMCRFIGLIADEPVEGSYAVLDVLDENGDIVQDFSIPTARGFQFVKRKLNLVVESED